MRTTKAVSISLLPAELKLAERLAKQTNRSLSGLFREGLKRLQDERRTLGRLADEYTPAQRQAIDADIAASMEDFEQGRFHGPFDTAKEASRYIERVVKHRASVKKRTAPSKSSRPVR
jgi:predicted transcriptional regulator